MPPRSDVRYFPAGAALSAGGVPVRMRFADKKTPSQDVLRRQNIGNKSNRRVLHEDQDGGNGGSDDGNAEDGAQHERPDGGAFFLRGFGFFLRHFAMPLMLSAFCPFQV